jgi:hypothetical protein
MNENSELGVGVPLGNRMTIQRLKGRFIMRGRLSMEAREKEKDEG